MGELLIEGPIVVRGYLNDEVRSSAVFLATPTWYDTMNTGNISDGNKCDPNLREPRFYVTGDLVQRWEGGSLILIGRKDRQVKIRGQKVDLNEIRHHFLSKTTKVQDLVAHYEGFSTGQKQRRHKLVAFVVARNGSVRTDVANISIMTDELRADLINAYDTLHITIPGFMIPTLFIPMTQIPLNIHSKIDSSKLS